MLYFTPNLDPTAARKVPQGGPTWLKERSSKPRNGRCSTEAPSLQMRSHHCVVLLLLLYVFTRKLEAKASVHKNSVCICQVHFYRLNPFDLEIASESMSMGPNDILIDLDETGKEAPPPPCPNKSNGDSMGGEKRVKTSDSSEDDSLDSRSENIFKAGHKSENSSIDSGGDDDDDSSLEDSVNGSTLTMKICNARADRNDPLPLVPEASLSLDASEDSTAENSHPLCCDDSPSCSSDCQLQSPSLHTLLEVGGKTPSSSSVRANQPRTLFHQHAVFAKSPPKEPDEWKSTNNEDRASPALMPHRALLFTRRRPATPPRRSNKNTKRSSPLTDASTRSTRNSYPLQALSPAHAMHRRTNQPPATPK